MAYGVEVVEQELEGFVVCVVAGIAQAIAQGQTAHLDNGLCPNQGLRDGKACQGSAVSDLMRSLLINEKLKSRFKVG